MKTNEKLREGIFEVINNQIRTNDPPETKATYDRLRKQGYEDFETMQMIGQCVLVELNDIMKLRKPWNSVRYDEHLKALPKAPFE